MSLLAEACTVLANRQRAAALHGLLSPHSGHLIVAGVGVICTGAADRFLGMLESTLHRWKEAEDHFEAALAQLRRAGPPIAVVLRPTIPLGRSDAVLGTWLNTTSAGAAAPRS